MKSVLKFVAYNKVLLNKLDINIKDYYDYKIKIVADKEDFNSCFLFIICEIIFAFIPLIIYDTTFYSKRKFNDKILVESYDNKKKNYVDIMDNYITYIFFGFLLLFYLFIIIIYNKINKISLYNLIFKIFQTHFFICLSYLITYIRKFV